jgi:hypothetical protein
MTMQLIQTQTLGTAAASISFTSIPQDGTDLLILTSLRSTANAISDTGFLRFNGSSTGYTYRSLFGAGSSVFSFTGGSDDAAQLQYVNGATSTANTFNNAQFVIPNYASTVAKSFSGDYVRPNNSSDQTSIIMAHLWNNTAAISSFIVSTAATFVAGSTISLYKITKGSDGIVTTS